MLPCFLKCTVRKINAGKIMFTIFIRNVNFVACKYLVMLLFEWPLNEDVIGSNNQAIKIS